MKMIPYSNSDKNYSVSYKILPSEDEFEFEMEHLETTVINPNIAEDGPVETNNLEQILPDRIQQFQEIDCGSIKFYVTETHYEKIFHPIPYIKVSYRLRQITDTCNLLLILGPLYHNPECTVDIKTYGNVNPWIGKEFDGTTYIMTDKEMGINYLVKNERFVLKNINDNCTATFVKTNDGIKNALPKSKHAWEFNLKSGSVTCKNT